MFLRDLPLFAFTTARTLLQRHFLEICEHFLTHLSLGLFDPKATARPPTLAEHPPGADALGSVWRQISCTLGERGAVSNLSCGPVAGFWVWVTTLLLKKGPPTQIDQPTHSQLVLPRAVVPCTVASCTEAFWFLTKARFVFAMI